MLVPLKVSLREKNRKAGSEEDISQIQKNVTSYTLRLCTIKLDG